MREIGYEDLTPSSVFQIVFDLLLTNTFTAGSDKIFAQQWRERRHADPTRLFLIHGVARIALFSRMRKERFSLAEQSWPVETRLAWLWNEAWGTRGSIGRRIERLIGMV